MRKTLALAASLLLAASPSYAQVGFGGMLPGPGTPHSAGGGGAYTGPGDLQTFTAWWSVSRAYSSATRGTKAFQICSPSDTDCHDILTDATTGLVSSTQVANGSTCNTSTWICTIKILYDKSGNAHDSTQTTIANRATFTPSCSGLGTGIACATCAGAGTCTYPNSLSQVKPLTMISVSRRTGNYTTYQNIIWGTNGGTTYSNTTNTMFCYLGNTASVASTDNTWETIQAGVDDTAFLQDYVIVNTTANTGLGCGGSNLAAPALFTDLTGTFSEAGIIAGKISNPTATTAMYGNIHTALGY